MVILEWYVARVELVRICSSGPKIYSRQWTRGDKDDTLAISDRNLDGIRLRVCEGLDCRRGWLMGVDRVHELEDYVIVVRHRRDRRWEILELLFRSCVSDRFDHRC